MRILTAILAAALLLLSNVVFAADTYCGKVSYCNNMKFIIINNTKNSFLTLRKLDMTQGNFATVPNQSKDCKEPWETWEPEPNESLPPGHSLEVYGHEISGVILGKLYLALENKEASNNQGVKADRIYFKAETGGKSCVIDDIENDPPSHFPYELVINKKNAKGTDAYIEIEYKDK